MKKSILTIRPVITTFSIFLLFMQCKKDTPSNNNNTNNNDNHSTIENTYGFNLLNKIKGIWIGPVTSTTALGGYSEWIVDFRPISENQISAKNELDTVNDIHMSFFIAKYDNQYKVCFRNGGSFAGQTRVSYFLADSVSETSSQSHYRFSEIIKGKNRAYTEVTFRNDSLIMKSYTNKYNTLVTSSLHMSWNAKLQDTTSCQPAVTNFNFPQKNLTKDFSTTFEGEAEAVYYSITGEDPYPESQQPYLGQAFISYTYAPSYTPAAGKNAFLIITTQLLITGFTFNTVNLKYRSRYVILSASEQAYAFNYMHPGIYYLYAIYDTDDNNMLSSGDWVSTANTTFTLSAGGTVYSTTEINLTIP